MKDKIDIGVAGTFGLPHGYTQSALYSAKFKANKSLDINTTILQVFPGTTLYAVRKEIVNQQVCLVFVKYSYAKERNSNRGGTFIGSCISFYNCCASTDIIVALLNDLHANLIKDTNNIVNDVLQVSHSEELKVKQPKDFENLALHLKPLDTALFSQNISASNNMLVYQQEAGDETVAKFFQKSIENFAASETLYFTAYEPIAAFVKDKNLLKGMTYAGFEKEIEAINARKAEEQRQRDALEKEKIRQQEEQQRLKDKELKEEAERAKQQQLEAEKQKEEAEQAERQRSIDHEKKIAEQKRAQDNKARLFLKKQAPSHQQKIKPEAYKNLVDDFNALLDYYKELEMQKIEFQREYNSTHGERKRELADFTNGKKKSRTTKFIFYIFIPFLFIVLLGANAYQFFIKEKKQQVQTEEITDQEVQQEMKAQRFEDLNPFPNSELASKERKAISAKDIKDKKIDDLVKVIFENNKNDIATPYSQQKHLYKLMLYKLNNSSFSIENTDTIFSGDSITRIPAFKKQR